MLFAVSFSVKSFGALYSLYHKSVCYVHIEYTSQKGLGIGIGLEMLSVGLGLER